MSTYTQILYHIVFSTKNREPSLLKENREQLFRYIWGISQKHNCFLIRINGVEDHIHLLIRLHPSVALAALVKDIKMSSHKFIKDQNLFPDFISWQEGYGAFTYSIKAKNKLINYIKNQEEHHKDVSYKDELISLLEENKVMYEKRYLI